jgi:DNA helicase-2/ATP-dependent DNA helicase PcrA
MRPTCLDLDDLLLCWHALARDELFGRKLEAAYEHVLVDEYQDLNRLQVEILRGLRRERRNLTVVGDDAQAIYGFRAASAAHILGFGDDFPDSTMVTLTRNYRSTQPILDVANTVWADAAHSYPKRPQAVRGGGVLPRLVYCLDPARQATEVCTRVLALYEEGVALREQSVLMRAGRHSNELELELSRRKIPFVKYGGIGYLEAAHVKDFVCALRIVDNPGDQLSWFRVLRLLPGVGPVTARPPSMPSTSPPSPTRTSSTHAGRRPSIRS